MCNRKSTSKFVLALRLKKIYASLEKRGGVLQKISVTRDFEASGLIYKIMEWRAVYIYFTHSRKSVFKTN